MASPLSSIFRARLSFSATSSIYKLRPSPPFTSISKTLIRRPAIIAFPAISSFQILIRLPIRSISIRMRHGITSLGTLPVRGTGFDAGYGNSDGGVNRAYPNQGSFSPSQGVSSGPSFPDQGFRQNQRYSPSQGYAPNSRTDLARDNVSQSGNAQNQGLGPNLSPNLVRDNVNQWSNNHNQGYAVNPTSNLERGYPQQGGFQNQGYPQNPNRGRNYTSNGGGVNQGGNGYNAQPHQQNQNQWGSYGQAVANDNRAPPTRDQEASTVGPPVVDLFSLCRECKVKEAIEHMEQGVLADAECFTLLFQVCGSLNKFEEAKKVHDYFLRSVHRGDLELTNKVLDMYSKCGSMTDARRVFDHMVDRSMDSWHLMINGYASNGLGDDGLALFEQMKTSGLQPNGENFLAVLEACANADTIEEGFIYFDSMKTDYGISPAI